MAKLPEFRISEDYNIGNVLDSKTLPRDSFVQPISERWVPKHCFDGPYAKFYSKERDTFCYTHFGIIPIPTHLIYEVK